MTASHFYVLYAYCNQWIDSVMADFSAHDLEVVGSNPANASFILEVSVVEVQLRVLFSLFSRASQSIQPNVRWVK